MMLISLKAESMGVIVDSLKVTAVTTSTGIVQWAEMLEPVLACIAWIMTIGFAIYKFIKTRSK